MEEEEDFPFPFAPYSIQKDFMINLYKCLDSGHLGIFESPTGTGKTMSIICGAVKWLIDDENKKKEELLRKKCELEEKIKETEKESPDDWFSTQIKNIAVNEEKGIVQRKLDIIDRRVQRKLKLFKIARETEAKDRIHHKIIKEEKNHKEKMENVDETGDLLLQDFEEHSEESEEEEEQEEEDDGRVKLFFCSRTHSQLTQFISEFKKSPYADRISLVPLGSRQNYCINKAVKRLGAPNLINERCLELQRSKKTTSKKEKDLKKSKTAKACPYTPGNQNHLIANIITRILDIEEITGLAEKTETCPYYASRKSLPDGQVIVLPYNTILHENTRTGSGISLKNSIIIIDEAHNILESIEGMHSPSITGKSLLHSSSQLSQYRKRFESLFSPKNLLFLDQLNFCLKKLLKILGGTSRSSPPDPTTLKDPKIYEIPDFEAVSEIDTVNIFDLIRFIKSSKLIQKLQGYLEKCGEDLRLHPMENRKENQKTGVSAYLSLFKKTGSPEKQVNPPETRTIENSSRAPLQSITSFLESLKSSCSDGRIFVIPDSTIGKSSIKFLLMNPAAHFHDIVKDSRSVILAGGTMAPMSEFRDQLFISAGADPERIDVFSCDHVVPEENIITRIITAGPNRVPFDFNYNNRNNDQLLAELGRTLVNLSCVIPGGIVVFLPSYNYEEVVFKFFERTGVVSRLEKKKRVFREPKASSLVNSVLRDYAEAVRGSGSGALLFSVVGGKLSEGLNFSDDLGRAVVVVGMPYPNIKSPELQEKMRYLEENVRKGAGTEYYENCCMKAVNQCIGRAVRHIGDYATVILLDRRFSRKVEALPGWIQRTLKINETFNVTFREVADFFSKKKNSQLKNPN